MHYRSHYYLNVHLSTPHILNVKMIVITITDYLIEHTFVRNDTQKFLTSAVLIWYDRGEASAAHERTSPPPETGVRT